ncbi:Twin-arginine translocation pathway signal sequence domain protein [Flavobacterium sp. 9AF]|uniref:DUF1501 domain-containing protein n=1 Tax=Flavobacterium sp. 9AF TaxID=2653142 RepID=UPI0012F00BB3|nr:DUF1501 domain-containing protein [Flavobacterium sp. 9AF]VXC18472.1 Twin-arginine translocation pathway signal sequence domain protein [Flavobacterium sp. 9AF]
MNRRKFFKLTGTFTSGTLIIPSFLHAFANQNEFSLYENSVIFIQLNGGNDGLNTFIPFDNPLYYNLRPNISIAKDLILGKNNGMGFHPALNNFAKIQDAGELSIIQNVGYPEPNRSHFRSQEIWQTATSSNEYNDKGWLGRYLDSHYLEHHPTGGINLDTIDNLALKGIEPNTITIKDPSRFRGKNNSENNQQLSDNPQLDFVRKIANSVMEGADEIQKALAKSKTETNYPKTNLGKNLEWIAKLIKGNLNSKIYYTSLGSFDTHDNQLALHQNKLSELNDAVYSLYSDLKQANLLPYISIVIFSEFGRRVKDNGNGTDHGTAAPMFIIGGNNQGKIIGTNPNLTDLDYGDLKFETDFRSVYASILEKRLHFDPKTIGIQNLSIKGLF